MGRRTAYLILALVLTIGWLIRLGDAPYWLLHPDQMQFQGKPLPASVDGYYFLNLARKDRAAQERPVADLDAPSTLSHVDPAPLRLPLPAQWVSSLVGIFALDPLWIAAWLPTLLAPLVAIPLFLLGRFWGGHVFGLTSAMLGVTSPLFAQRSAFAEFDTDMLIPTLLLVMSYGFLRFARGQPAREYRPLLTALSGYALFLWWWDRAPAEIVGMHLFFIAVSWSLFRLPRGKDGWTLLVFLILSLITFYLARGELPSVNLVDDLLHGVKFFMGRESSSLPPVATIIEEFYAVPWQQATTSALGHPVTALAGLVGLLLLTWHVRWEMLFMFPLAVLGLWGLSGAMRLLIFTGPLLALGVGHLVGLAWHQAHSRRSRLGQLVLFLGVVAMTLPAIWYALPRRTALAFPASLVSGMAEIDRQVPRNAWIWSLWDAGHPLRYWARRPVIFDGHVDAPEAGERLVYNTLPLATPDAAFAARFMLDYTARGLPGMREYQQRARGDWDQAIDHLRHPSPPEATQKSLPILAHSPPLYLFLFRDMLDKSPWWYPFATWSFTHRKGKKPFVVRLEGITHAGEIMHVASVVPARTMPPGPWQIDVNKGLFMAGEQTAPLARMGRFDGPGKPQSVDFANHDGLTLLLDTTTATGYLVDEELANSVFVRLWFFQDPPRGTFRLVRSSGLDEQLWEVLPPSVPSRSPGG
ncbi:MAG: hypothetical protein HQL64_07260 [Magnetococcales bacterium]|nr:hypothetical protein [Magnetococcales bacterium]